MNKPHPTYAFIDAQNLIKGTRSATRPWKIDLHKFRIFLQEKYHVTKAFYFIGVYNRELTDLYSFLEKAGYKVVFREHNQRLLSKKKGNVDTDIVFMVMDLIFRKKEKVKVVLVTGDGDYKKMVNRLISEKKFRVLMFPNKNWSAIYNKLPAQYKIRLYNREIRHYLELKKK
jgi:uncharacterized LabA/DUF88 family protein